MILFPPLLVLLLVLLLLPLLLLLGLPTSAIATTRIEAEQRTCGHEGCAPSDWGAIEQTLAQSAANINRHADRSWRWARYAAAARRGRKASLLPPFEPPRHALERMQHSYQPRLPKPAIATVEALQHG
jgi:hypothetical protein